VATTTAPTRGSEGEATGQPPAPVQEGTAPPTGPAEASEPAPAPSRAPYETGNSLLSPPDYDNIVGGVPPSPYASLVLLGGLLCLIASAVGTALGADMFQWWVLGAMLIAVAVFLAGFVSRA
jgi:hypothetical protein